MALSKVDGKSACLWHAFDALKEPDTEAVKKAKLKVLTHNIGNCLGLVKVEEKLTNYEDDTISFPSYNAFIQSEIFNKIKGTNHSDKPTSCMEKVDEVCWFVCCNEYRDRSPVVLNTDNMFILWKIFNTLAETESDDIAVVPVVMDCEEVEILASKFCKYAGTTFNATEFKKSEISLFSFRDLLNYFEECLCGTDLVDMNTTTMALKEIQDEVIYEVIKKGMLVKKGHVISTLRERWFVLTPFTFRYFASADEKELKGEHSVNPLCKIEILGDAPKGTHRHKFRFTTPGKAFELFASDLRTRSDWQTAIRTAVEYCKKIKTPQQNERSERKEKRENQRRLEQQMEKKRKQSIADMDQTKQELEEQRKARKEAEEKAREEAERRRHEEEAGAQTRSELEAVTLARKEAEEKAREEAERRRHEEEAGAQARSELEVVSLARKEAEEKAREEAERRRHEEEAVAQARSELEAVSLAHDAAAARLIEISALREEDKRQLEELLEMKQQLEKLLTEETQAKRDEEIVRSLQARALQEELEKREELEMMKEKLQQYLLEEQHKRVGLEEIKKQQEDLLQAEQEKYFQLKSERQKIEQQFKDATVKLSQAENAKLEMEEMFKKKQKEKPPIVQRLAAHLPDIDEFKVITHRGEGAFCEQDFKSRPSLDDSSAPQMSPRADSDSGVPSEGSVSPVFDRKEVVSFDEPEADSKDVSDQLSVPGEVSHDDTSGPQHQSEDITQVVHKADVPGELHGSQDMDT